MSYLFSVFDFIMKNSFGRYKGALDSYERINLAFIAVITTADYPLGEQSPPEK
jgi:hypothetical protein